MTRYVESVERAGHELRVTFSASPGDPGRTSGPPEHCYPPEGPEFDLERIDLQWSIPDDLGPDAKAQRIVWLDVTDLLLEVGGDQFADDLADELLDKHADEDWYDTPEEPEREP